MKAILFMGLALFSLISFEAIGQQKNKKAIESERKILKQKEIEDLISSKNFIFNAQKVLSQKGAMFVLDYNTYFVQFDMEKAVANLPFFGRAFSVSYGSDGGIKFEGKPENVKIEQKKKSYVIKATVKGRDDIYDLLFSVFCFL